MAAQPPGPPDLPLQPSSDTAHVPGEDGWPILGNTLRVLRDHRGHKTGMLARHGPVYRDNLFGARGLVFAGPQAAQQILVDRERNFSSQYGWHTLLGELFGGGLMLRDFGEHHAHRRIMKVAFGKEPMKAYMDVLNPQVANSISSWASQRDFRFYPAMKKQALVSSARVFLGLELESEMEGINRAFIDMLHAATAIVRAPIPGTTYWRGQRGRAHMHAFLQELVTRRRHGERTDMCSFFCRARDEDGHAYSDEDIVQHMSFMLMAAHDTTTSALTNMVFELARHPDWQERIRGQLGSEPDLGFEALSKLGDVELVMREALRLYPPVLSIPRRVVRPCEIMGTPVAANTDIWIHVDVNHRLAEWWREPEQFDPERFSPERAEHRQHPYLWIPFGGGAHRCLGMRFAELNIKCFIHHLLSRYRIRLPEGYQPRTRWIPFPRPSQDLPLVLEPLSA